MSSVTVNVTSKDPVDPKTCVVVRPVVDPPSEKLHTQLTMFDAPGLGVDADPLNVTVAPAVGAAGWKVKLAVAPPTGTGCGEDEFVRPALSVTVKVTE